MKNTMLDAAQDMLGMGLERGARLLADRVQNYVAAGRELSDGLQRRGETMAAEGVSALLGRVDGAVTYLENRDGRKMLRDARELVAERARLMTGAARSAKAVTRAKKAIVGNRTAMLMLGGLAVGLVAGRLIPVTRFERKTGGEIARRSTAAVKETIEVVKDAVLRKSRESKEASSRG